MLVTKRHTIYDFYGNPIRWYSEQLYWKGGALEGWKISTHYWKIVNFD